MDALFGLFVLAFGSLSFSALMPALSRSQHMSNEASVAVQIASREIEQLRLAGYDSLDYPTLLSLGLVDTWSGEGPYTFSSIPGEQATMLSTSAVLRNGVGELEIWDAVAGVREVVVRVRWTSASNRPRSIALTTLIARDA